MVFNNQPEPQLRYLRACSNETSRTPYFCVDRAGTGTGTKNRFCSCESDGCNTAGKGVKLGLLTILAVPLSYLLSRQ